jgi:hypothetical protein
MKFTKSAEEMHNIQKVSDEAMNNALEKEKENTDLKQKI